MDSSTERLHPLDPPYTPEIEAMLKKWMPPDAAADPLKLFRVLARHPELMDRMRPLGAGLLSSKSSIDPAEREIVIDRVCARCGCEYEWGVHVAAFGAMFGISPERLTGTVTAKADDSIWSTRESILIQLVDELHDSAHVSDELWERLQAHWDTTQIIELLILIGWYHLISFVANAAGISPEAWAARLPNGAQNTPPAL